LSITLHILFFDSVVLAAAYQVDAAILSATEKKNKEDCKLAITIARARIKVCAILKVASPSM
jgi:hypothetical protein